MLNDHFWMVGAKLGPNQPGKRLKSGDDFHVFGADPGVGCEVS
jgi:hypothetical protein